MPPRPHRTLRPARLVLLAGALLPLLAACGGASSPTEPMGLETSSIEAASAGLANQARRDHGVGPLMVDPRIADVARSYSEQMKAQGYISHFDESGGAVDSRLAAAGVRFSVVGENLAAVSDRTDPAGTAHRNLMASPEHRANILEPRFTSIGVGVVTDGTTYWITQIFVTD